MEILPKISPYFHIKEGFCHPDWDAISGIIENSLPEAEWNAAWESASLRWLNLVRQNLGGSYQLYETENFVILSEAPMRVIKDACKSYENSLREILAALEGVALDEGYGKHVVMMLASLDDYYGYISYFYPEGEHPMSGGVCLSGEGYIHFAFLTTDYSSYRTVLVHELTHGCLGHLPIPTWINEALAMRMEQVICNSDIFHLDQEVYDRHLEHWNQETIQEFWSGKSWELPGESFDLSYNLAQVLWRKIEIDFKVSRSEILQFILEAHYDDSGESACKQRFNFSLEDLVIDFLGEGKWAPQPEKWID